MKYSLRLASISLEVLAFGTFIKVPKLLSLYDSMTTWNWWRQRLTRNCEMYNIMQLDQERNQVPWKFMGEHPFVPTWALFGPLGLSLDPLLM